MTLSRLFLVLLIVRYAGSTSYPCNSTAACGCSQNSATVSRIVGGEVAGAATWAWAVSLRINGGTLCGGTIISASWVVTAGHCARGVAPSKIIVYSGSNLRWSGTANAVSQVIVHPNYDPQYVTSDIALLQLSQPLDLTDPSLAAICLPFVSASTLADTQWPPIGIAVVAIGWGTLSNGGPLPSALQQVTVLTADRDADECSQSIIDWQLELCAGVTGGGKDTCQGDSGGPLMMFSSSNQWVLVGTTSYGIGCAGSNHFGIYTRVAEFSTWIRANARDSNVVASTSSTSPRFFPLIFFFLWIFLFQ